jgi:hypothetical protein
LPGSRLPVGASVMDGRSGCRVAQPTKVAAQAPISHVADFLKTCP